MGLFSSSWRTNSFVWEVFCKAAAQAGCKHSLTQAHLILGGSRVSTSQAEGILGEQLVMSFEGQGLQGGWAGGTVDFTRDASSSALSLDWEGALEMNSAGASSEGGLVQIVQKAWKGWTHLNERKLQAMLRSSPFILGFIIRGEQSTVQGQVTSSAFGSRGLPLAHPPLRAPAAQITTDLTTSNNCLFSFQRCILAGKHGFLSGYWRVPWNALKFP